MATPIVECVPNFSEARDPAKIKQITSAIEAVSGVKLLDVDPGLDMNRTVVTFVGSPEAVAEAAFQAIAKASQLIDMSKHRGSHPRMGATDVCPFIPVSDITLEECAEIAKRVGRRVGDELGIPVYLYEAAASAPYRSNLADIRRGEYEGLEAKMREPEWKPDFGPNEFNAKAGATVIGSREFLIAYNITLNTRDKNAATDIAFELREKGRVARGKSPSPYYIKGPLLFYKEGYFPCGNCDFVGKTIEETEKHCRDAHGYDLQKLAAETHPDFSNPIGKKVVRAGKYPCCKSIGWYADAYKRAQISINLTNYKVTPPHVVLEEARRLAAQRGLVVTGSEVVGMIPYNALLESGRFYLKRQGRSPFIPARDILEAAVFSLGLSDVQPFDIDKKVIGLPTRKENALVDMIVVDFTDEVSRETPAPGGGSIAALAGSIGAALASMVANITHGKIAGLDPEKEKTILDIASRAQSVKDRLLNAVDEDTDAFNAFLEAIRLPQETSEQKKIREEKMQEGIKHAISVPFATAEASYEAMQVAYEIVLVGNQASITDGAVGCEIAYTGVRGGLWNVAINLKDVKDPAYVKEMQEKCAALLEKAKQLRDTSGSHVDAKLLEMIKK